METQSQLDFKRIALAIDFIKNNFKNQPSLEEIAQHIHLSPAHFQKLFTDWAGTSPKKFLQYISLQHAKDLLKQPKATLFDTAEETGFSSTSRLHDLFISLEGMTPAEYKNGGKNLNIGYEFAQSPFGEIIVASTKKGICYLAFVEDKNQALETLICNFPNAEMNEKSKPLHQNALLIFQNDWSEIKEIKLHLKGSDFQLRVWETLLKIPMGGLSTYGKIAEKINQPKASRAVGTAVGKNPIAFIIPCHRVIQSSGILGGYHWGTIKKTAMIGWESAQTEL